MERDLLAAGEQIVRVPPKLMANTRDGARTFGKSDPIDALAVARAALREPHLPVARLDGTDRELRLLVDHREDLVAERTRMISRLRWHLHELDPRNEPAARALNHLRNLDKLATRLDGVEGTVARLAREITERCRQLTVEINALETEITALVQTLAPSLIAVCGCGPLTAAKIVGETAGIDRFKSNDAYARHNGTALAAGLVIEPGKTPTESHRQPPAQRRDPPDRAHPGPPPPRRPGHDRATQGTRRRRPRSPPRPQTQTLRRRLPRPQSRRRSRTPPRRLTPT